MTQKAKHTHDFVENYSGPLAQGFDRQIDLATLQVYLQKISSDDLMEVLLPRLTEEEVSEFFNLINSSLKRGLSSEEYHGLFLKSPPPGPR
ncbi:MAG: cytoplasmic protein [Deltaproteobacteria bacterium]|jgi:hypothetical protein|nr:cytoplasmic protein [Deltaproteobacteria bacterium]